MAESPALSDRSTASARISIAGRLFVAAMGVYAIIGGAVTLSGWFLDRPALTDWDGDGISMMPNAALCAILAAIALLFLLQGRRVGVLIPAGCVVILSAATLFQSLSGVSLGIDTLLVYRPWGQTATLAPGRMGPNASTCWILIATGMMLATGKGATRGVSIVLGLLVLGASTLSLMGYLFGASKLFSIPSLTAIALQTASMIFALGLGLLRMMPEKFPTRLLLAEGGVGMLLRRATPLALLIPVGVSLVRQIGQERGLYDTAFGIALHTWIEMILFCGLLCWAGFEIAAYERKLHETTSEVRRTSGQLSEFLQTAAVGLHRVGPDGMVLWANEAELRTLGYTPNEYIGHHLAEFHTDAAVVADILARLRRGEKLTAYPARMRRRDGSTADVLIDSSGLWENGRYVHSQCFTRDITAQKAAERDRELLLQSERAARGEAEQAARMKDEFIGTISHELRTPLSGILGWAQVLRRAYPADGKVSEAAEAIERGARAQARLIDDLLDLNRIMSGKLRLDVQDIELIPLIESAIETVRPSAEAKGIRIQATLGTTTGPIKGDPDRLQQVVWNLLSNAVKFTPRDGKVQVQLARVNSHIEISVADTGLGIRPDFLPHVFERFRQADSSMTRRQGGLGLGLAIVKQIVELHGGTVSAFSAGEGKGATFHVRLPVSAALGQAASAPIPLRADPAGSDSLAGLQILVIDDDPSAAQVLRVLLEQGGAIVRIADSGPQGLSAIAASPPDLLLCDIGMPDMDGYEVIRKVRSAGDSFPAVAVTAFARPEDRVHALQNGFNMHLAKPVDARELFTVIETLTRGVTRFG